MYRFLFINLAIALFNNSKIKPFKITLLNCYKDKVEKDIKGFIGRNFYR